MYRFERLGLGIDGHHVVVFPQSDHGDRLAVDCQEIGVAAAVVDVPAHQVDSARRPDYADFLVETEPFCVAAQGLGEVFALLPVQLFVPAVDSSQPSLEGRLPGVDLGEPAADGAILIGFQPRSAHRREQQVFANLLPPDVILNRQQLAGRVVALYPIGVVDRHGADPVPVGAFAVSKTGQQLDHVGDVVFTLGVVVVDHSDAVIEDLRTGQVQAGVYARRELLDLFGGISLAVDLEIVLTGVQELLELGLVDVLGSLGQCDQPADGDVLLLGVGDVLVDDLQKVGARDVRIVSRQLLQLVDDCLPCPIGFFDDIQGAAVGVDEDPSRGAFGGLAFWDG